VVVGVDDGAAFFVSSSCDTRDARSPRVLVGSAEVESDAARAAGPRGGLRMPRYKKNATAMTTTAALKIPRLIEPPLSRESAVTAEQKEKFPAADVDRASRHQDTREMRGRRLAWVAILSMAFAACKRTNDSSSPSASTSASNAPAPAAAFATSRDYACADPKNAPTDRWGHYVDPEGFTRSLDPDSALWESYEAALEESAMSSLTIDPLSADALSAVKSAFDRVQSRRNDGGMPLHTSYASAARYIAKARVRFAIDSQGDVDHVNVAVVDASAADAGSDVDDAMRALTYDACNGAPYTNVPAGTQITYWLDRSAAGFDASAITGVD
jgi:hypothetical protein